MSFPVQVGLPQIILLVLALFGLGLFASCFVGLGPPPDVPAPEGPVTVRTRAALALRRLRVRPRLRLRRGAGGFVLLILSVSLLWFTFLVQTYLGLTGEIRAARVTATPVENAPHTLSVELTLYDDDGGTESRHTYQVEGDRWVLQANIVELKRWVNVLGVHSGYKVTRLFGQYDDGTSPDQRQIFLNGGDDDFFKSMRDQRWFVAPFVRSAYGNAVIAAPGEYDVYVSQDAIKARAVGG